MSLRIYNTLGRRKEIFSPLKKGVVGMYVCGVTVYDDCHLGHGRAYVSFDIVRRYLEYKGYRVVYVQNITDIDDKIIAKANAYREKLQGGITLREAVKTVSEKYTEEYFKCMDKLNVRRAGSYPKATEHIPEMVKLVEGIVEKGYAYVVDGDVFFSVEKFLPYGKLSGRNPCDMKSGARVEVDVRKEHPLDFVLWKKAKEDEPSWESPWGMGRPGWHIECSAMSMKYLGGEFDIHGGGQDLIFPHHENEIAQSEAYTGRQFAKYWLHNGFVTVNKEKMSKSLGNFFTLREIFEKYEPQVVRLFLVLTHYRHPIDFSDDALENAAKGFERLMECDRKIKDFVKVPLKRKTATKFRKEFEAHMDNDFNTPGAIAVIFDMMRYLNTEVGKGNAGSDEFRDVAGEFVELRGLIGLSIAGEKEIPHRVRIEGKEKLLNDEELEKLLSMGSEMSDSDIERLVARRSFSRKAGDWENADKIRSKLSEFVRIQDTPDGILWKRIVRDPKPEVKDGRLHGGHPRGRAPQERK